MTSHNEELLTRAVAGVFIVIGALFFINIFNLSYPIRVITSTTVNELAVVGEGKVEVVPDIAYVDVGITVDKVPTVMQAQDKLTKVNNALVAAMKKLGIDKKMIKTSNYSVNPNYSYKNEESKIDGYTGNATLSITVKDLSLVSRVITAATNAGANQINGSRFDIENPSKYREQARDKAIMNAQEEAAKIANRLGITLGKVVNIVESSDEPAFSLAKRAYALDSAGGGASLPDLQPGVDVVVSRVTLYFEKN